MELDFKTLDSAETRTVIVDSWQTPLLFMVEHELAVAGSTFVLVAFLCWVVVKLSSAMIS